MLETSAVPLGIPNGRAKESSASTRSGHHSEKPRRRRSKDDGGRMGGLWCASGQRSPTFSFDATSPYDIPHLVRPPPAAATSGPSSNTHPPSFRCNGVGGSPSSKAASEDSGVGCKSDEYSGKDSTAGTANPRNLPPSGSTRPSSAMKPSQRNPSQDVCDAVVARDVDGDGSRRRGSNPVTMFPKSRMLRSLSSFSLKTFSLRRKDSTTKRPSSGCRSESASDQTESRMEQSRKRIGGSLPGDDRLNLSNSTSGTDEEIQRKRTNTQIVAQRLSRLGRSLRRRRSADRAATETNGQDASSESSSTTSSTSNSSSANQAVVLYGTASRARRSSFKISISVPSFDTNGNSSAPERCNRKSGCEFSVLPLQPNLPEGVRLIKILKLEQYLTNKWISGMAVSDKNELIIVDLRSAYLVDDWGNLIRTIGSKGSDRLIEPIGVSVGPEGRLVFSDHAQQNVKVFTSRGNHLRTVTEFSLANIAGVACNRSTGEIFVAGTDRKRLFVHSDGQTRTIPADRASKSVGGGGCEAGVAFKHPFSVAYNSVSGEIIVGDDYDQSVMAVSLEGQLMWRFCPPMHEGERQFFPSSVCVDQDGAIFVADLYNGKVCMLDSRGQLVRVLLSRDLGLSGNPGAIATDCKGHIYVADEERTVKVFQYQKVL